MEVVQKEGSAAAITASAAATFFERYKWYIVVALLVILIGIGVGYGVYALIRSPAQDITMLRTNEPARITALEKIYVNAIPNPPPKRLFPHLVGELDRREQFLINVQPLTVRLPGFLGPAAGGTFNEDVGVKIAIAAGARGFFIPLTTYYDENKKPPAFPDSGLSAIVARKDSGVFMSDSVGFLSRVIQAILKYKDANQYTAGDPIVIYLHADEYAPDAKRSPNDFKKFTNDIAAALSPLTPYLPQQMGQLGATHKGRGNEILMLKTPIEVLRGKIILMTNMDIVTNPVFGDKISMKYVEANKDGSAGVKLVSVDGLIGSTEAIRESARINQHIALPGREQAISVDKIQEILGMGVQVTPLDFVWRDDEVATWKVWGGSGWRVKEKAQRYIEPEKIVPQKPSAKLNAKVQGAEYAGQIVVRA